MQPKIINYLKKEALKKNVVGIHNGILFGHEKVRYPPIYNHIDGPCAYHANQDNSDRERQALYDITYRWDLKKLNL